MAGRTPPMSVRAATFPRDTSPPNDIGHEIVDPLAAATGAFGTTTFAHMK